MTFSHLIDELRFREQTARQARAATLPDPGESPPAQRLTAPVEPAASSQGLIGWSLVVVGGGACDERYPELRFG